MGTKKQHHGFKYTGERLHMSEVSLRDRRSLMAMANQGILDNVIVESEQHTTAFAQFVNSCRDAEQATEPGFDSQRVADIGAEFVRQWNADKGARVRQ